MNKALEVLFVFLRLGFISFGGPIAHTGYFQDEFVNKKKWLTEKEYVDIVSLCQFIPGPASSQVGMVIGRLRAGFIGSILAWIGFTLPSALLMISFALGILHYPELFPRKILHGFKIVAVVVVAQALLKMGGKFCYEKKRIFIFLVSLLFLSFMQNAIGQIIVILVGGLLGKILLREESRENAKVQWSWYLSSFFTILFFLLILFLIPILENYFPFAFIQLLGGFYKTGALVFGGGHVVLPLLKEEMVANGFVKNEVFLSGYGFAQTLPGPLFSVAAFLGSASSVGLDSVICGLLSVTAIFLPGFLLVYGFFPLWEQIKNLDSFQSIVSGINSSVYAILFFAFYDPIYRTTILSVKDFTISVLLFSLLQFWKLPIWLIVILSPVLVYLMSFG